MTTLRSKNIKNYETKYEVHDDGTVWSKTRVQWTHNHTRLTHYQGRQLKLNHVYRKKRDKNGIVRYESKKEVTITLSKQGAKPKTCYVHRLVAEAFIPNPNHLPEINHIDGNPENNYYQNLEWCSSRYNETHSYLNGFSNGKSIKLTDSQGVTHTFNSHQKASDYIHFHIDSVLKRYPNKRKILGYTIALPDDDPNIQYDYTNYEHGYNEVDIIDTKKGNHHFRSYSQASMYMGFSATYLNNMLKKHPNQRKFNGYIIKLPNDSKNGNYNYTDLPHHTKDRIHNKIKAYLISPEKDMLAFYTYNDLNRYLGKSDGYLSHLLYKHPKRRNIMGYQLVLVTDSPNEEYDYTNYDKHRIITLMNYTHKKHEFNTLADAGRFLNMTPTQIHAYWYHHNDKPICRIKGYTLTVTEESLE